MNELFEPADPPPGRVPPEGVPIEYDDALEAIDAGYRYVLKRPSESSAGSSAR